MASKNDFTSELTQAFADIQKSFQNSPLKDNKEAKQALSKVMNLIEELSKMTQNTMADNKNNNNSMETDEDEESESENHESKKLKQCSHQSDEDADDEEQCLKLRCFLLLERKHFKCVVLQELF